MKAIEVKHPLIQHKVAILRDKKTGTKEFRELAEEIAMLLCYEAMRDAEQDEVEVETPITKIIPNAKIGVIGLYRNEETMEPVKYYYKVPKDIQNREVILVDPMLATGGSAVAAIKMMKEDGVKKVKFLCLIAAPEGIKRVEEAYPDVQIYCASIDDHLNEDCYIVPGLGDAGDRIFGIK